MGRKKFDSLNINNVFANWEACMVCGFSNSINFINWCLPLEGTLKFNVNGEARGKLGRAGVRSHLP